MIGNPELWTAIEPQLVGLKRSGSVGNYEAKCPLGQHKTGKPFSVHPGKGVWRCFNGHGQGTLYALAKEMGCLPSLSQNLTRARTETIPLADWGLDAAMRRYGVRVHERGVIFAVYDHEGNRCRDHVRLHKGEPRFQYWGEGRTYHALVDWPLVREWGQGCGILNLVEGNRDWLTLAAHGWPAIGVLGIDHFGQVREKAIPHVQAAGIGCLVLNPDNDEAGLRAADQWVSTLVSSGFLVGIRRLPDEANGQRVKDIFDLFQATKESFNDVLLSLPIAWRGQS